MARDASCWGHVRRRIAILDEHAGAFPSLEYVRSTSIAVFAAHVAVGTPIEQIPTENTTTAPRAPAVEALCSAYY